MSGLVSIKRQVREESDPLRKTFNRLKQKIASLQNLYSARSQELDEALEFYHHKMYPAEQEVRDMLVKRSLLAYQFLQVKNRFSKTEKENLKSLILYDLDLIFKVSNPDEVPEKIQDIFEELSGYSYTDLISDDFEHVKSELQGMCEDMGIDLDLADIKMSDTEEEILSKMFQGKESCFQNGPPPKKNKPKTKKQIEAELKQQKVVEMQERSANTIYRRLAKAFHPDLEPDEERKKAKEELMKKLTAANDSNDLYTLLQLEMEWIQSSEKSSEQLQMYNAMLKRQIDDLKLKIDMLFDHPRYIKIQKYYYEQYTNINILHKEYRNTKKWIIDLQHHVAALSSPKGIEAMKQLLYQEQIESSR